MANRFRGLPGTGRRAALLCAAASLAFACCAASGCSEKVPDSGPVRPESNVDVDEVTLAESTMPNEFAVFHDVAPDADGMIRISTEGIGRAVSFFNVDVEGTTVQILALRDKWGKVHVAFNTCQSCTPSPKAFYTQVQGVLRCTACGFTFEADEVGAAAGGCNPWPIPGVSVTPDEIVIPYSSVTGLKDEFSRWEGEVE